MIGDRGYGISDVKGCILKRAARRLVLRLHRFLRFAPLIGLLIVFGPGIPSATGVIDQTAGTLTASLDKDSAAVGGVIWLTLNYRLPQGGRLPEKLEVKGLDGLRILKQIIEPRQVRIQLLVDRLNPWQSEPIGLTYLDSNGQPQVLTADPVSIQVISNLGEKPQEAQPRPIQGIYPIISVWRSYLFWAVAISAVVLVGIGIFWWYKSRRIPKIFAEYMDPPHIRARKEIQKLESQKYFEKGKVKTYYFLYSEILRRYLESIRDFPAAEFTTEEIAQHIRTKQDRQLIPLLQWADLVKFADTVPTPARKEEDIKAAQAFIRETSPPVETSQDAGRRQEVQP
ncbi:MAG: hypothetical protein ACXAC5_12685 [Promethearchaeota archaeon]